MPHAGAAPQSLTCSLLLNTRRQQLQGRREILDESFEVAKLPVPYRYGISPARYGRDAASAISDMHQELSALLQAGRIQPLKPQRQATVVMVDYLDAFMCVKSAYEMCLRQFTYFEFTDRLMYWTSTASIADKQTMYRSLGPLFRMMRSHNDYWARAHGPAIQVPVMCIISSSGDWVCHQLAQGSSGHPLNDLCFY